MLDEALLGDILKTALSSGGDYADLFVERKRPSFIHLEDDKIEKTVAGMEEGAGIRVIFGERKTAYGFTNELTPKALLDAAKTVGRAAAGGQRQTPDMDLRKKRPLVNFNIKLRPEVIPMGKKVEMVVAANRAARGLSGKIRQVSVIYRDTVQRVTIASSDGSITEDERVHTVGVVQVVAEEGGVIQTGYEPLGGLMGFELFDESPLEEAALRAARRAVMMLRAKRAPGGRMPVVISGEAGGTMIHEAIGHGLEADLALQGLSAFSGKIGLKVASERVTVIDDSTLPNKRGSFRFDDEGTPSQRTVLVKDGILMGYMYDRLMARTDGRASTGNGRRESYHYRPIPRMTNTFIAPGASSPEEALRATARGLFVRKMGGGQVDTVTGDFVFDVQEGYLIEDGKAGEPLRGATLSGNGPEVLKSIDIVCSDLGFSIGTCGKDDQGVPVSDAMPTVRVPEMVVGGQVQ